MSRLAFGCALAVAAFSFAASAFALDVPPLTGRVVDLAHALPNSTVESLTAQLAAHEGRSSNQVAVLIIPSLEGEPLEAFSHRVATSWKLGKNGTDNGVLLLLAVGDRKIRIEVGYGLEGVLTDIRSAHIIRNEIVPRLRAGDVAGGVTNGINAIVRTIEGTYQATEQTTPQPEHDVAGQIVVAVMVGLLVGLLFANVHRFVGPMAGAGVSILLAPWLVPALLASGVTLLLLLVIGASGAGGRSHRSRGIDDWVWYSSHGGGWGGGAIGGGGGFIGGGGDFGGGGASGNW